MSLIDKGISGRGERIRTSGLYVPNVALYQAKLHPADEIQPARDLFRRLNCYNNQRRHRQIQEPPTNKLGAAALNLIALPASRAKLDSRLIANKTA